MIFEFTEIKFPFGIYFSINIDAKNIEEAQILAHWITGDSNLFCTRIFPLHAPEERISKYIKRI